MLGSLCLLECHNVSSEFNGEISCDIPSFFEQPNYSRGYFPCLSIVIDK